MKKNVLLFLMAIIVTTAVFAQTSEFSYRSGTEGVFEISYHIDGVTVSEQTNGYHNTFTEKVLQRSKGDLYMEAHTDSGRWRFYYGQDDLLIDYKSFDMVVYSPFIGNVLRYTKKKMPYFVDERKE